jgi:hypothetical protein
LIASRREYNRLIAEWKSNNRVNPAKQLGGVSIAELVHAFWTHAQEYYAVESGKNGEHCSMQAGAAGAEQALR